MKKRKENVKERVTKFLVDMMRIYCIRLPHSLDSHNPDSTFDGKFGEILSYKITGSHCTVSGSIGFDHVNGDEDKTANHYGQAKTCTKCKTRNLFEMKRCWTCGHDEFVKKQDSSWGILTRTARQYREEMERYILNLLEYVEFPSPRIRIRTWKLYGKHPHFVEYINFINEHGVQKARDKYERNWAGWMKNVMGEIEKMAQLFGFPARFFIFFGMLMERIKKKPNFDLVNPLASLNPESYDFYCSEPCLLLEAYIDINPMIEKLKKEDTEEDDFEMIDWEDSIYIVYLDPDNNKPEPMPVTKLFKKERMHLSISEDMEFIKVKDFDLKMRNKQVGKGSGQIRIRKPLEVSNAE